MGQVFPPPRRGRPPLCPSNLGGPTPLRFVGLAGFGGESRSQAKRNGPRSHGSRSNGQAGNRRFLGVGSNPGGRGQTRSVVGIGPIEPAFSTLLTRAAPIRAATVREL